MHLLSSIFRRSPSHPPQANTTQYTALTPDWCAQSLSPRADSLHSPEHTGISSKGDLRSMGVTSALRYPALSLLIRDHLLDLRAQNITNVRAALLGPGGFGTHSPQTLEVAALLRHFCPGSDLHLIDKDPEVLATALNCSTYPRLSGRGSSIQRPVRKLMAPLIAETLSHGVTARGLLSPAHPAAPSFQVNPEMLRKRVTLHGLCNDFRFTNFESGFPGKFDLMVSTYALSYALNFSDPESNWRLLANIVRGLKPNGIGKFFTTEGDITFIASNPKVFRDGMAQLGLNASYARLDFPKEYSLLVITRN